MSEPALPSLPRIVLHGLLRPSPWYRATVEPPSGAASATPESERVRAFCSERERARQQRIDDILGPLAAAESAILKRSIRDAYEAQVPLDVAAGDIDPRRIRMLHPLSAETVAHVDFQGWQAWFAREDALLDQLHGHLAADRTAIPAALYRDIWRQVINPGTAVSGAPVMEAPIPGSLAIPDHDVTAHRSLAAALCAARVNGERAALLSLHLGPVQGFIAHARRTHDLWIGSYTVAYLTLRAAVAVAAACGPQAVVLPSLAHIPAAAALLFPQRRQTAKHDTYEVLRQRLRSSLSNKIVAVVTHGRAQEHAQAAMNAARTAWRRMAAAMKDQLSERTNSGEQDWCGFDAQIDAHLELDAVVQPWPDDLAEMRTRLAQMALEPPAALAPALDNQHSVGAAYGALYNLGHRILAAQRRSEVRAWAPGDSRPKCTQCGQREQMGPVDLTPQQRRRFFDQLGDNSDRDGDNPDREPRESLQLTRGEGLCAVCMTKRLAPKTFYGQAHAELGVDRAEREDKRRLTGFPSTYSIASAPFRQRLLMALDGRSQVDVAACQRAVDAWLAAVAATLQADCLDFTSPGNLLPGLSASNPTIPPAVLALDGQWFYESTYQTNTAWLDHYPEKPHPEKPRDGAQRQRYCNLKVRLDGAREKYKSLRKLLKAGPSSYFAVLVLDGDKMGQWLVGQHPKTPTLGVLCPLPQQVAAADDANERQRLQERRQEYDNQPRPLYPALHGELSQRLARLALALHDVVETTYLGRVIYSGGDDLLAFLPLATVLPCLRDIEATVRQAAHLGHRVTVSAGLCISHARAPLGRALEAARAAEKAAKRAQAGGPQAGRPHLCISVLKRAGAPLSITLPWRLAMGEDARTDRDTLAILTGLLAPRGTNPPHGAPAAGDPDPLLRISVAQRLVAELAELGLDAATTDANSNRAATVAAVFRHRVRTLLDTKSLPQPIRDGFDALLAALAPSDVVTLVQLLRFWAREDHGIDAHELCRHLKDRDRD